MEFFALVAAAFVGSFIGCNTSRRMREGRCVWFPKATQPPPPAPPAPPPITEGRCLANMKCEHYREMPKGPPPALMPVPPANLRIKAGVIPTAEEVLTRPPVSRQPETRESLRR